MNELIDSVEKRFSLNPLLGDPRKYLHIDEAIEQIEKDHDCEIIKNPYEIYISDVCKFYYVNVKDYPLVPDMINKYKIPTEYNNIIVIVGGSANLAFGY